MFIGKNKIIASSNDKFKIELVEKLSKESQFEIFSISKDLEKIYEETLCLMSRILINISTNQLYPL